MTLLTEPFWLFTVLTACGHSGIGSRQKGKGFNKLRPRQNGRHFADDTFKRIFLNENVGILIKISLKFVPKGTINNTPALVHMMAWRRPGDKPLFEPMVVRLPTHIYVTRPQWVKAYYSLRHPWVVNMLLLVKQQNSQHVYFVKSSAVKYSNIANLWRLHHHESTDTTLHKNYTNGEIFLLFPYGLIIVPVSTWITSLSHVAPFTNMDK